MYAFNSCDRKLIKISFETFQKKPTLLNFINLFTRFFPRLEILPMTAIVKQ